MGVIKWFRAKSGSENLPTTYYSTQTPGRNHTTSEKAERERERLLTDNGNDSCRHPRAKIGQWLVAAHLMGGNGTRDMTSSETCKRESR